MSVGEWLDLVILQSARQEGVTPGRRPEDRHSEAREEPLRKEPVHHAAGEQFAEVSARLETLSRQLDRLATAAPAPDAGKGRWDEQISRQIAGALSQLDRRLDKMIVERRPAEGERPSPQRGAARDPQTQRLSSTAPASPLDQALAEIAERQRMLDSEAARPDLPRAPTQGLGGLEQQLRSINSQIESLRPCAITSAVEGLRDDLAEIGSMIKEAMPRQAIEALETEVRSLAQRIDNKRHAGADASDLAGVERGLVEVRDALRALTPAESLVGFDSAVRAMSEKIDGIAAIAQDPTALEHLEGAIAGLRGIVSHVATNDALARLSEEVRGLAAKVERVTSSDTLAMLEQRITFIADALQSRPQPDRDVRDLEALVRGLADKIERLQLASAGHPNSSHIDEQIAKLIERIESSDVRLGQLDKIERGLAELLLQIDRQPGSQQAAGGPAFQPEFDTLKRDVQRTHEFDRGRTRHAWAGRRSADGDRDRAARISGAAGARRDARIGALRSRH